MFTLYRLLKILLIVECVFFVIAYFTGTQGLSALRQLQKENAVIKEEITLVEKEISELQSAIDDWHHYPYYKEKIAREQLQMMRKNETIYIIS